MSGRVQTMCFDKTGTLTESGLDVYAVQATDYSAEKVQGNG